MSGASMPSRRLSRMMTRGAAPRRRKAVSVELGPGPRARVEGEEADALAAVAEGEEEEPRAAVLPRRGEAHHRPLAVIDLSFLARCGRDRRARLGGRAAPQAAALAHHARVAGGP